MLTPSSFSNRPEPKLRPRNSRARPGVRTTRCRSASNSRSRSCSATRTNNRRRSRSSSNSRKQRPKDLSALRLIESTAGTNVSGSGTGTENAPPDDVDSVAVGLDLIEIDRELRGGEARDLPTNRVGASSYAPASPARGRSQQSTWKAGESRRQRGHTSGLVRFSDPQISSTHTPRADARLAPAAMEKRESRPQPPPAAGRGEAREHGAAAACESVEVAVCGSSKSPCKKKQRNRSASVKRRSRPIFREVSGRRKRNARAPSRSRSRDISGNGLGSDISKSMRGGLAGRPRSRSPRDHSKQWLYTVGAENSYGFGRLLESYQGQGRQYHPPLRGLQSDDVALMAMHERIREELGLDRIRDGLGGGGEHGVDSGHSGSATPKKTMSYPATHSSMEH